MIFLSTLSLRRATRQYRRRKKQKDISIHALLAESDKNQPGKLNKFAGFLSTLSLRRATTRSQPSKPRPLFLSTLSLRRATDGSPIRSGYDFDFYPRSPCGERQVDTLILANAMLFLSTLSLRRATVDTLILANAVLFLSTLSLRRASANYTNLPGRN